MNAFFAVSAPGLAPFMAQELARLGQAGQVEEGGVAFGGELAELYRANLCLRTASRVLVRLGSFYAAAFSELRKKAARLPWGHYLSPGQPVALRVTCHRSRLYHSDAVAERLAGAIGDCLGRLPPVEKFDEDMEGRVPQLVVVRLAQDLCTISIDSSGALLHRRGYRLATAKAPLRETLAAGILLASGWDARSPLLDPFCGSGTIAIEAALLAAGQPPGAARRFAFMDWPDFQPAVWESMRARHIPAGARPAVILQASDRDAGAVRLAQANAERAGVGGCIDFSCRAVSAIEPPPGPGWVVTNPPYGLRVGADRDLRNLYARLGDVLRLHCPGWQVAILGSDTNLLSQTRLKLDTSLGLVNGGVNVRLGCGRVPA